MKLHQTFFTTAIGLLVAFTVIGCRKSGEKAEPVTENPSTNTVHVSTSTNDTREIAIKIQHFKQQKDAHQAHQAMRALTNKWNPVGKTVAELQALLGAPDERTPQQLNYRFDTGWGGWVWTFHLSAQTITNVQAAGME